MTVRILGPEDAPLWRSLRLEMLREAPTAYGSRYAEWAERPLSDWEEALRRVLYVASFDGAEPVGAMGCARQTGQSARHRATLIAVWLRPEYRGSGRAQDMLDRIVELSEQDGILQLELGVEAANGRAIRFYERNGFVRTGTQPRAFLHDAIYYDQVLMLRLLDRGGA